MIRQKILQQLLEWIECNLEHPISIEDIAQEIWLQQTQHPASVPKFHACAFGRIHSQTKALSCRHSCPALREIYA